MITFSRTVGKISIQWGQIISEGVGGGGVGGEAILMRRRPITQLFHPKNNPGMRTSKVQIVSKMILRSNHIICRITVPYQ